MSSSSLKQLHLTTSRVARHSFGVTTALVIGAVLDLARDVFIARTFGAGTITDAFFLGSSIPFMFTGALQEIGQRVLMPWFGMSLHQGRDVAEERLALVFFLSLSLALVLAGGGVALSPAIAEVLAGSAIDIDVLSAILRVSLPTMGLGLMISVLGAYLNASGHYISVALRRSINSAVFLLAAFLLRIGDVAVILAVAFLLGYVAEFVVLLAATLPALHCARMVGAVKHRHSLGALLKSSLFPALVILSLRANLVLERVLAGFLTVGSVSALAYARRTTLAMGTILTQGTNTVALSEMSRLGGDTDRDHRKAVLSSSIRLVLLVSAPIAAIVSVFRIPLTQVLFGSRLFGANAVAATSTLVSLFGLAIPCYVLVPLLLSTFYAKGDTRTPSFHNLIILLLNLGLNLLLVWYLGAAGIALAFLLALLFSVFRAWVVVNRQVGELDNVALGRFVGHLLVSTLVLAIVARLVFLILSPVFQAISSPVTAVVVFLSSFAGLSVFVVVLRAFKVREVLWLFSWSQKHVGMFD